MGDYRQLLKDDLSIILGGDDNVFSPIHIKRMIDGVEGDLKCSITNSLDEMLLQNYRLFEVEGGDGLYLDNRTIICLQEDWLAIFKYPPVAKVKFVIDKHMFEIRKATDNLGVFYHITMASLRS